MTTEPSPRRVAIRKPHAGHVQVSDQDAAFNGHFAQIAPDVDECSSHRYEQVTVIDQGANFESLHCPRWRVTGSFVR